MTQRLGGVDDRDDHARVAGLVIPGIRGVDVRIAVLVQAPEVGEPRVIRRGGEAVDPIRLRIAHFPALLVGVGLSGRRFTR